MSLPEKGSLAYDVLVGVEEPHCHMVVRDGLMYCRSEDVEEWSGPYAWNGNAWVEVKR